MLWITFTLIGIRMSLLLKRRKLLIEETLVFLNCLAVEISYSREDIVSIVNKLSSEKPMMNLLFLKICSDNTKNGLDFPEAWREAVNGVSVYKREEKEKLLQLGSFLGTSDSENQINTIKVYSSFFEEYRNYAEEDYDKYGKVSTLFGVFLGAAIFILMF